MTRHWQVNRNANSNATYIKQTRFETRQQKNKLESMIATSFYKHDNPYVVENVNVASPSRMLLDRITGQI